MMTPLQQAMRNVAAARAAARAIPAKPKEPDEAALDALISRQALRIAELEVALAKAIEEKTTAENGHQAEREAHQATRVQLQASQDLATAKKGRSHELLIANQSLQDRVREAEEKAVAAEQRAVAAEQLLVAKKQRTQPKE